jgi:predicted DNA-binding transcriptional regulator AlpA
MTDNNYLTLEQVAEHLQIPAATLRYWRHKGTGPRSAKFVGVVRYRASDVEAWVEAQFAKAAGDELAPAVGE